MRRRIAGQSSSTWTKENQVTSSSTSFSKHLTFSGSGKQQLNWWLKAWQFSGLDEPAEAFDVVVMAHPSVVPDIADQCTLVTPQFSAKFNGSGKCFYKPYIGLTFLAQNEN